MENVHKPSKHWRTWVYRAAMIGAGAALAALTGPLDLAKWSWFH